MGVTVIEIAGGSSNNPSPPPPLVKGVGTKGLGKEKFKVPNYLALQREIYRQLSRKVRKIAKFSTALKALLGMEKVKISPIGKLTAIIMAAKVEQYIAQTCKIQHSFTCVFRSKLPKNCTNRTFRCVSTIYYSFRSASHSCGSDEGSLQPSLWLTKFRSTLQKLTKCSTVLHAPLGIAPIECFVEFLQYIALYSQPATHVVVMSEAYSHHYGCQS